MLQLCVCRDIEHLGSLESTQEARVALGCASCNSYASFVLSRVLNISTYARWRMRHATLYRFLYWFWEKTDCFAVYTFTGAFRVCLKELIYNLSTEFT